MNSAILRYAAFSLTLIAVVLISHAAIAEEIVSVQVQNSKIRAEPKLWAAAKGTLAYGAKVTVVGNESGDWLKVRSKDGVEGYLHKSAVTTKKIVFSKTAGARAGVQADDPEILLAGKGFNKETEADMAGKNPSLNFRAVDNLEQRRVSDTELRDFIKSGGLNVEGKLE